MRGLPYIKDSKIYDNNGRVIEKPSVLFVEGEFIAYGTMGYLKFRSLPERKKLLEKGKSLSEISIIPLYELLDLRSILDILVKLSLGVKAFNNSSEDYISFKKSIFKLYYSRNFSWWDKKLDIC